MCSKLKRIQAKKHGGRKEGDVFMKYTAGGSRWDRRSMIHKGVSKLERLSGVSLKKLGCHMKRVGYDLEMTAGF